MERHRSRPDSLSALDGSNGFRLRGSRVSNGITGVGDVNGDGYDDLMLSATGAGDDHTAAYLVFGAADGLPAHRDVDTFDGSTGVKFTSVHPAGLLTVAAAGDINGDGYADVAISFPDGSATDVNIVFGTATPFGGGFDLDDINASSGMTLTGRNTDDRTGARMAPLGDINGDGVDDLFLGAQMNNPYAPRAPTGYVVFGRTEGLATHLDLGALDGANGFIVEGSAAFQSATFSALAGGDINGDGINDVVFSINGVPGFTFDQPIPAAVDSA